MKFCQMHWDELRNAIDERGMSHLIAKNGEQAVNNIEEELQGGSPQRDPLMSCFFMIMTRAVELGGLYMMSSDYCPVCEAVKHTANVPDGDGKVWSAEELERWWIDGPADAELKYCQDIGLMPKPV